MSAVLSEAETKFFSSKGADVDASLTAETPAPAEIPQEVAKPVEDASAPPAKVEEKKPPEPPKDSDKERQLLGALQGERDRRQKAEQERQQFAKQLQEMQEQIRALSQPQEEAPNPEEDPQAYLIWHLQQQNKALDELRQWREQQENGRQQQESERQQRELIGRLQQRVQTAEVAFRQSHPDYDAAAKHAITLYDKMLSASIPDPGQRMQQIQAIAAQQMARVIAEGGDPAQFVYDFAKSVGYAPANPNPAPAAPANPAPTPAVSEVVKTLEKGLKQQSKGGGATPPAEMSAEQLLALDGDEFLAGWDKAFKRKR